MGFHFRGLIITLLILLPNLFFFLIPPRHIPESLSKAPVWLTVLERIGQIGCFAMPLVFGKQIARQPIDFWVALMALCLLIYYICWIRYFAGGRDFSLLYTPLWIIPVPMALFPVIYFLLLGLWVLSPLFLIPAALLALGHMGVSLHMYSQIVG